MWEARDALSCAAAFAYGRLTRPFPSLATAPRLGSAIALCCYSASRPPGATATPPGCFGADCSEKSITSAF